MLKTNNERHNKLLKDVNLKYKLLKYKPRKYKFLKRKTPEIQKEKNSWISAVRGPFSFFIFIFSEV